MKAYVLDTSTLVRLYVPDGPLPENTETVIERASRAEAVALVPEFALAEIAQVLFKKTRAGHVSIDDADEIIAAILELPLEVIGHREILPSAFLVAREESLAVYDALFLALAESARAELVTADERLAAAARRRGC